MIYTCETTAAEIVKMKEQRPQMWRPHPEIPHIKEARQFYCLIRQELRKELENIKSRQVDWSADIEAEAARHLSQQIAPTTDSTPDGIARIAVAHDALQPAAEEKEQRAEQLDPEKQAAAAAVAAAAAAAAEKARRDAAKKVAQEAKRAETKAQKERDQATFKASPMGKAQPVQKDLMVLFDSCKLYVTTAQNASFLSGNMRLEWVKTFEDCEKSLKACKKTLDKIFAGTCEDVSKIHECKAKMEIFKKQRRCFDAMKRATEEPTKKPESNGS